MKGVKSLLKTCDKNQFFQFYKSKIYLKSLNWKANKYYGGGSVLSAVKDHYHKAPKVKDSMYVFIKHNNKKI